MDRILRERDRLRPGRLDLVLTATAALLIAGTVILIVDPQLDFVIVDKTLDVALNSIATLAGAGLAALAMSRYRESGRLSSLFQASALFLLSVVGGVNVVLVLLKLDGRIGPTLGLPAQFPVYISVVTWLMAAILFVVGAAATLRSVRVRPAFPRRLITVPPLAIGVLAVIIYPIQDQLPPLISNSAVDALIRNPQTATPLPGLEPLLLASAGATAFLLLLAAVLLRFAYVAGGPVTDGFLSVGLVIAAFGEFHFALYPGVYTGLVTTGDALNLAFYGALLLGIDAEARSDLRALRTAYATLDRLRVTETERAALEERSRLAREIHDGLAQHLWFAKLKHERLAPLVPDSARGLSVEVGQALDAAIVEARQALVTMRSGTDPQLPLGELLSRTVEDFGNRSGLRVRYSSDDLPAAIPARQQAELLRVVQEALTNVGKHADATMVWVRATMEYEELVVTVGDNGRGFDPHAVRNEGLGIRGMEERARLVGGQLALESQPSDGTRVILRMPIGASPTPARGTPIPAAFRGSAAVPGKAASMPVASVPIATPAARSIVEPIAAPADGSAYLADGSAPSAVVAGSSPASPAVPAATAAPPAAPAVPNAAPKTKRRRSSAR